MTIMDCSVASARLGCYWLPTICCKPIQARPKKKYELDYPPSCVAVQATRELSRLCKLRLSGFGRLEDNGVEPSTLQKMGYKEKLRRFLVEPLTPKLIGARVKRKEDRRLLTGQGAYVDDHRPAGLLYAAFLRSPYAHAQGLFNSTLQLPRLSMASSLLCRGKSLPRTSSQFELGPK